MSSLPPLLSSLSFFFFFSSPLEFSFSFPPSLALSPTSSQQTLPPTHSLSSIVMFSFLVSTTLRSASPTAERTAGILKMTEWQMENAVDGNQYMKTH